MTIYNWVILYDISDTKRLQKTAKILESFGKRVQRSVFEVYGPRSLIDLIKEKVDQIIEDPDTIVYIPLCATDWEKTRRLGTLLYDASENEDKGDYGVVIL